MADAVDEMMAQWRRIRPDLDPSPMGVFGRVARLNRLLERELKQYFERHGLEFWEFDGRSPTGSTGWSARGWSSGCPTRPTGARSGSR